MREETRKIKKGKIIAVLAVAVIIVIAVVLVVKFVNKDTDDGKGGSGAAGQQTQEQAVVYDLPDVTYSDMQVTDIEMEYLEDNNETMVSMIINNTTENQVENESLTAYLIDANGETVGQTRTFISSLAPGAQYSITVILKGNLTTTKQIKLQK